MTSHLRMDHPLAPLMAEVMEINQTTDGSRQMEMLTRARHLNIECRRRGFRSAIVVFLIGYGYAQMGMYERALGVMRKAIELDPLRSAHWTWYRTIVVELRAILANPNGRDVTAARRLNAYRLLERAGETTMECHLAYARLLRAAGRTAEALEFLRDITRLYPAFLSGWEELADVAQECGDSTLSSDAQIAMIELLLPLPKPLSRLSPFRQKPKYIH